MDLTAFGPYAFNVRTNISSYGPRTRLIRAYDYWALIYTLASKLTLDSKMRVFQYKILNNILYLNQSFDNMKLADMPLSTFCQLKEETISDLFLECNCSKTLSTKIRNWLEGGLPNLNCQNVVLGFVEGQFSGKTQNFLLLLYKRLIYNNRFSEKSIRFEGFNPKGTGGEVFIQPPPPPGEVFWLITSEAENFSTRNFVNFPDIKCKISTKLKIFEMIIFGEWPW